MDQLRVAHYDIRLEILPATVPNNQKLYGGDIAVDCALTIHNTSDQSASHCTLDLYRLLDVKGVADEHGASIDFTQGLRTADERHQINSVSISFDPPLAPDTQRTIRLNYAGAICGCPERLPYAWDHISSTFSLLRGEVDWYPRPSANPWASEFNYVVRIVLPSELSAVSAGEDLGIEDLDENRKAYTYRSEGLYRQLIIAAAPFSIREISGAILYTQTAAERGITLAQRALAAIDQYAVRWLGNKPQTPLRIVEIPKGYGSQSTHSAVWQTADGLCSEGDESLAYARILSGLGHEALHRWHPRPHPKEQTRFLDEGLTHYLEALLLRNEIGEQAFSQRLESYRRGFLSGGDEALSTPIADSINSSPISRGKGPWVFAVLHALLGDEAFFSLLRAYAHRYANTPVTLADFAAVFNEYSPRDLQPLFADWLYGTASSTYLSSLTSPEALAKKY